MNNITIWDQSLTYEQAKKFLKDFKSTYKEYKDSPVMIFNGYIFLISYAKYLIEYIENYINREKEKNKCG